MGTRTLGQQIRALREAARMSTYDLALKVGYGVCAIEYWEADISVPGTESLHTLAAAFNCRVVITRDSINLIQVPEGGFEGWGKNGHSSRRGG